MPLVAQVEPGGEVYLQFAKRRLAAWHVEMLASGKPTLAKVIHVDDGTTIYVNSAHLGNALFRDRIRITASTGAPALFLQVSPTRYVITTWDLRVLKAHDMSDVGGVDMTNWMVHAAANGIAVVSAGVPINGTYYMLDLGAETLAPLTIFGGPVPYSAFETNLAGAGLGGTWSRFGTHPATIFWYYPAAGIDTGGVHKIYIAAGLTGAETGTAPTTAQHHPRGLMKDGDINDGGGNTAARAAIGTSYFKLLAGIGGIGTEVIFADGEDATYLPGANSTFMFRGLVDGRIAISRTSGASEIVLSPFPDAAAPVTWCAMTSDDGNLMALCVDSNQRVWGAHYMLLQDPDTAAWSFEFHTANPGARALAPAADLVAHTARWGGVVARAVS